jgi:hypothetical protein
MNIDLTLSQPYTFENDPRAFVMPYKNYGELDRRNMFDKYMRLSIYDKGTHKRFNSLTRII